MGKQTCRPHLNKARKRKELEEKSAENARLAFQADQQKGEIYFLECEVSSLQRRELELEAQNKMLRERFLPAVDDDTRDMDTTSHADKVTCQFCIAVWWLAML